MKVYFIRHGMTEGNRLSRYIGSTDEPLSEEGLRQAAHAETGLKCERVFVSPLLRTAQTAAVLFPGAKQEVIDDFREMDFGAFESRSAADMENDPQYRSWVDGMCIGRCPGGESREEFCERVCGAFSRLMEALRRECAGKAVLVVHGGTVMAILERFAIPKKDYFAYRIPNCGLISCTVKNGSGLVLTDLEYRSVYDEDTDQHDGQLL